MVEQLTCNQWVGGSIPFAGSIVSELILGYLALRGCGEVPEWSKGADCKSAGSAFGGSNPPLSTTSLGGQKSRGRYRTSVLVENLQRISGNSSVG